MRDYKNQTSRPQLQAPRAPIAPRRPVEPEDDHEETSSFSAPARRWPWVLLLLVVVSSAGIWWWIARLPLSSEKLGLVADRIGLSAMTVSGGAASMTLRKQSAGAVTRPGAQAPMRGPLAMTSSSNAAAAPAMSTAATRSGVDFRLYRILPNMHVDIPADILGSGPGIPSAATARSDSGGNHPTHQPVTIQVGAFTNRAAAIVLRDRLALLGVGTQMEKVETRDHHTFYRLRTRTFDSLAAAQPTLAKIRGMGITPLLLGGGIIGSDLFDAPLAQPPAP